MKTAMIAPSHLQERREPWERQPGETPRSYEAFKAYLDLGSKRSLAAVRRTGAGRTEAWSARHAWVRRAAAWDAHLEASAQREIEKRNTAARASHHSQLLEIRHEALTVARQVLREVSDTLQRAHMQDGRKVSPRELADIARSVAEVARAVGAGTSADEVAGGAVPQVIDMSRLPSGSMVELMRLMVGGGEAPEPQSAQLVEASDPEPPQAEAGMSLDMGVRLVTAGGVEVEQEVDGDAPQLAERADEGLEVGGMRPPLHGGEDTNGDSGGP